MRILFVCSENRLRSPTAAEVFGSYAGIEAISAGTNADAETPVSGDLIEWADIILVMEETHRKKLGTRFRALLRDKKLAVLGIPDKYDYMQPELVSLLKSRVARHVRPRDVQSGQSMREPRWGYPGMTPSAGDEVVFLYQRHADAWDRSRAAGRFVEAGWLDRFLALLPAAGHVLDLGCGSGAPVARYLIEKGFNVTGVDAAPAMIGHCRRRFPAQQWILEDMRHLSLRREFDGLLAWDSYFHLSREDQRAMFAVFRRHAGAAAALMFNTGNENGEATGSIEGDCLYHASLAPEEYRGLLRSHGFRPIGHRAGDPDCGGRTVWLARFEGKPGAGDSAAS